MTINVIINENNVEENPELSFSRIEGKCYCCGKARHKPSSCRWKRKQKQMISQYGEK
jgi:hypothetical protein